MERIKGSLEVFEQDSKDELPPQLGIFFRSPLFVLSEKEVDEEKQQQVKLPEIERQRRQAVSDCRYQVQIFFNNLLVCSSEEHKLEWPSFSVPFGEIISLRVFEKPKQLSILLKEKFGSGGNWQLLAEIFIPLPKILEGEEVEEDEDEEIIKNKWMSKTGIQFASTIVRGSYKGSLGCGQGGLLPFTQGRLFCSLKWKGFEDENRGEKRNFQKIKRRGRTTKTTIKSSILYQQSILCPEENLQKDSRLLKLERRWNKERSEGGGGEEMKRILIKFEKMDLKEEEEEEETDFTKLKDERRRKMEEEEDENELERHLRLGKEFVLKLRENLRQTGEQQRKLKDLSQYVREEPLPKISFGLLTSLLNGRQVDLSRRLKPFRGGEQNAGGLERGFNQDKKSLNWTKILLNIQSANAVPQRINNEPMQIYLVCSLKGQTQITSISDGHQPNWHETLIFDIQLNEEEDEETILTVELFDREIKPFEGDDREVDIRHERVENRWLGFGQILLNSKALNYWTKTKLDGYLSLQTPLFYTGYNLSSNEEGLPTTLRIRLSVERQSFITRLSASEQLQENTLGETDLITTECLKLESKLRQRFPNRRIISLAINSSGRRIVICKYLREINPPIQIINLFNSGQNKNAVKLACKLVALIPLINERMEKLKEFVLPIWLTVEEVIRIGFACADELAIVLCCWLLGLKLNCYILLGSTLSNGPNSAFVLIQFSDGEQWIIDPTCGHHYSPTNPNCPQLSIGTIFNNKNIFINIQNDEHPSQLNFDFTKKNNWENIFCLEKLSTTTTTSQVLASIQSEYLQYEPLKEISSSFLLELRTSLERELRLAFDETRPFAIPQWNLLASRNLREFLSDLFASNFFDDENIQQQQQQKLSENYLIEQHLKPLLSSFKICLISFCRPFINKKQIIEALLRLKLQQNSHSKTQFALAVYLKPLMGSIISCSVVICTLIPIV